MHRWVWEAQPAVQEKRAENLFFLATHCNTQLEPHINLFLSLLPPHGFAGSSSRFPFSSASSVSSGRRQAEPVGWRRAPPHPLQPRWLYPVWREKSSSAQLECEISSRKKKELNQMSSPCPGVNRASSLIQHSAAETEKHVTSVSLCAHNQRVCLCTWRPLTTACNWRCTADSVLSHCCTSTRFADPPSLHWDNDPHRTRRPESVDTLHNALHPEDTHTHGETLKYIQPELFCTHPHRDKEATWARSFIHHFEFIWLFFTGEKGKKCSERALAASWASYRAMTGSRAVERSTLGVTGNAQSSLCILTHGPTPGR